MDMVVYNTEAAELIGLLEEIIIDEYISHSVGASAEISIIYDDFLQLLRYKYRWFGLRSMAEFNNKWTELREEFIIPDSDFEDSAPGIQITLLTTITQRLSLITTTNVWHRDSSIYRHLARIIRVYHEPIEDDKTYGLTLHDAQISTTITEEEIIDVLVANRWLCVVILIGLTSNRCILQALGYIQNDSE